MLQGRYELNSGTVDVVGFADSVAVALVIHKSLPEPVTFPHFVSHLLDGYVLRFGEEEQDEERHYDDRDGGKQK